MHLVLLSSIWFYIFLLILGVSPCFELLSVLMTADLLHGMCFLFCYFLSIGCYVCFVGTDLIFLFYNTFPLYYQSCHIWFSVHKLLPYLIINYLIIDGGTVLIRG